MKKKSWLHLLLTKELQMDDDTRRIGAELREIGERASEVGRAMTKTLTLPLLHLGERSAQAAKDFEASFANVARQLEKGCSLGPDFHQLAKEIPLTDEERQR